MTTQCKRRAGRAADVRLRPTLNRLMTEGLAEAACDADEGNAPRSGARPETRQQEGERGCFDRRPYFAAGGAKRAASIGWLCVTSLNLCADTDSQSVTRTSKGVSTPSAAR